jgi:hypothetical protein
MAACGVIAESSQNPTLSRCANLLQSEIDLQYIFATAKPTISRSLAFS